MKKILLFLIIFLLCFSIVFAGVETTTKSANKIGESVFADSTLLSSEPFAIVQESPQNPFGSCATFVSKHIFTNRFGLTDVVRVGKHCPVNAQIALFECLDSSCNRLSKQGDFTYKVEGIKPKYTQFNPNVGYAYKCWSCTSPSNTGNCVDSDNGITTSVKGTTTSTTGQKFVDRCTGASGSLLLEWYCSENGVDGVLGKTITPPENKKCSFGKIIFENVADQKVWCLTDNFNCVVRNNDCLGTEIKFTDEQECFDESDLLDDNEQVGGCFETDSGKDFNKKGITTSTDGTRYTDYCTGLSGNTLKEFYCTVGIDGYNGVGAKLLQPPEGKKCNDGALASLSQDDVDVWCLTTNFVCVKRVNSCIGQEVKITDERECFDQSDIDFEEAQEDKETEDTVEGDDQNNDKKNNNTLFWILGGLLGIAAIIIIIILIIFFAKKK